MKKRKVLLSTLAAAVFATSAGALVACGDGVELPDGLSGGGTIEVTFNANGGMFQDETTTKKVTVENGRVSEQPEVPDCPGYRFTGYFLEKDGDGITNITYGANGYEFKASITVYAHWEPLEDDGGDDDDTEYLITFNGGLYGTIVGEATIKTVNKKIATPPTLSYDATQYNFTGWTYAKGAYDPGSTEFDSATTVTAQYTVIGNGEDDDVDPNPPARIFNTATINDEEMEDVSDTIDRTYKVYDDWEGYQNHTLADKFKKELTVTEVTTYTFKGNGTAISTMWIKYAAGLEIKIDGTIATQAKDGGSITLAPGTYTIYLENYQDKPNLWVEGTKTGTWEGGNEDDEGITVGVLVGGESKVTLDSNDEYKPNWTDGKLHDHGKAGIELNKNDVVTFTVDGTPIEFNLDAYNKDSILALVTATNPNGKNSSVTVKANGTYNIYLKEYSTGWVLDLSGMVEGEEQPTVTFKHGTTEVEMEESTGTGVVWQVQVKNVQLALNEEIQFIIDGKAIAVWAEGRADGCDCTGDHTCTVALEGFKTNPRPTKLKATVAGTYTIYFKCWGTDNYGLWVEGPAAQSTPTPNPDDGDELAVGQYIKVGDEYRKLTAGDANEENDEAEYYNVKLELTQKTTIKLWAQSATSGATRKIKCVKINGSEKYKNESGTDSYDLEAGSYNIHYKVYKSGWIELDIAMAVDLGDAIAISAADANKCATITIGNKTIKLYIKDGDKIVDINTTTFYIWTWNGVSVGKDEDGNNIGWPGKKITANMTLDGELTSAFGFNINKGGDSTKTGDLLEINDEGIYVINYVVGKGSVAPGVVQD